MDNVKEGSPDGVSKTTSLVFKNPEHPDAIKEEESNYWEKFSNYEDIRTIREDYAVSLKELFGEFAVALSQIDSHMPDEERNLDLVYDLADKVNSINKKTKLTDWSKNKIAVTKTTSVTYKNPTHRDNYVQAEGKEGEWYNAIDSLRDKIATDIYYPLNDFAEAVVAAVENDNFSKLQKQIDYMVKDLEK